ncbi:MAG TPA: hypothetical protein VJM08_03870 [Anaerolineales bacterium]|nr:hypothetical protein [Anaerolineales bacterium]
MVICRCAGKVRSNLLSVEIILVDSVSTDRTIDIAESFGTQTVRIFPNEFTLDEFDSPDGEEK